MSLATIIKKIEDDAQAHRQKLIEAAEREAEQVIAQGRQEAQHEAEEILQRTEGELENFKNKQMATAQLQARKTRLDNRQQILNDVFVRVLERVLAYEEDQYRAIMKSLLLSIEEEREATIFPAKADAAVFTQEFVEEMNSELSRQHRQLRFQLSPDTTGSSQGCLLDFQDFEINYSLEKILSELWENLKSDIIARLFEDGNH